MSAILKLLYFTVLVVLSANYVYAHTHLNNLDIDNKQQHDDEYIRQVKPQSERQSPVVDVTSKDMICRPTNMNWNATKVLSLDLSKKFAVEWHHDNHTAQDFVISESHHGPCLVYMALNKDIESKKDKPWFKIYEQGNKGKGKWCTDYLRSNHGKLGVTIPKDIPNGDYLLRTEIIALHHGEKKDGAQFFPNCAQLTISGATGKFKGNGPEYVAIPGLYQAANPGILYNIHKDDVSDYKLPGPSVYGPDNPKDNNNDDTTTNSAPHHTIHKGKCSTTSGDSKGK